MATTHYDFPTINGADAIDGVNAINGLANAVDTALFTIDSALGTAETDIAQAIADAASASTAATAASTNAAAAQATAGSAVNTANAAANTASATANALIDFEQKFNLVPNTVTSGLAMNGWTYSFTLAQNSDGSIFKFYGSATSSQNTSKTMTRVSIPGGSGSYAYGVATGLTLNIAPDSAYQVTPGGIYYSDRNTGDSAYIYTQDLTGFVVGTNGQIYIMPSSNSSISWANSPRYTILFFPCLYFNTSFGDTPITPGE